MRCCFRVPSFLLLVIVGVSTAPRAAAQPAGSEFRVNAVTTNAQTAPSVAADSAGRFVVVWSSSGQDGSMAGVFGRRFFASGAPLGAEFLVNTTTTDSQGPPAVASDSSGNFVVVWQSSNQDGSSAGIFGQRFASSGAPAGAEFHVNTYTTNLQAAPSVASDSAGNFVVAWSSKDGSSYGIFAQRYSSSGSPLGGEFGVNSSTTGNQALSSVARDPSGSFVVAWMSTGQDGSPSEYGVFGQRFASSGSPLGAEFRVNAYTTGNQLNPSVAAVSSGDFLVVWVSAGQDGSLDGVFGRRFGSSGTSLGAEFRVNTYTTEKQNAPSAASGPGGDFVVVWNSYGGDGSNYGVFAQRYASSGAPFGTEFRVNTYTSFYQLVPSVAIVSDGDFAVVWQSFSQDGSVGGVFAQRYCPPLTSVTVAVVGSTTVCPTGTGGTVTVTDGGGGFRFHQWFYRALPAGSYVPIAGETGASYVINGPDFPANGLYAVVCQTSPDCGSQTISAENVHVTVSSDATPPAVTAPPDATATQTLCQ